MPGQTLSIRTTDNESFSGYLATAKEGKCPGIVLVQEIFGVNKGICEAADRFAKDGYTVLAPDLFWRFKPNIALTDKGQDLEEAFDYYHRFNVDQGVSDLGQAVKTLRQHPNCNGKVVIIGFCLGGKLAYLTAAHHAVNAAVAFYGGGIADHLNLAKKISCPLLMHFGDQDEMMPAEQIDAIRAAFANRIDVEIETYPGVGHAFYNHTRSSYNASAAALAHQKTLRFLKQFLLS
jgi:carboxymethylenebutenolidase